MARFIIVCIVCGILFGFLDGVINANPFAQDLLTVYKPIARASINVTAGIIIDLLYGFALGFLFVLLYSALPGETGVLKGVSFAVIVWFLRVVMGGVSSWMMFTLPAKTLLYIISSGFLEMLALGMLYGIFVRPFRL
jgi:hypothetical protein